MCVLGPFEESTSVQTATLYTQPSEGCFVHVTRWVPTPTTSISFSWNRDAQDISVERKLFIITKSTSTVYSVHLLVELCHALLWDVIGPDDDQWIEGRDGETEGKAKKRRLRQECCLEERCMFLLQVSARGTSLTARCRVWRHDGRPPIACRGPHCPDAPPQACSPAHTRPGPQRRSSTGHCLNCTHTFHPTFHPTLESGVSFPVTY